MNLEILMIIILSKIILVESILGLDIWKILNILWLVVVILLWIAIATWVESKMLGAVQSSSGPNMVGMFGLLQPIADGINLIINESVIPSFASNNFFLLAPIMALEFGLVVWVVIPTGESTVISDINLGIMLLFYSTTVGVAGILLAGWASNSKYALLGSMRTAAQMISYEICVGVILLPILVIVESLNVTEIVSFQTLGWFIWLLYPSFMLYMIAVLAEINSVPFDLPEAESELVSGYNVEYSSIGFVAFFLAEYSNLLFFSVFTVCLFFGGWAAPITIPGVEVGYMLDYFWFFLNTFLMLLFFVWVRGSLPRVRYDQLMMFGWQSLLPWSLIWSGMTIAVYLLMDLLYGNGYPSFEVTIYFGNYYGK